MAGRAAVLAVLALLAAAAVCREGYYPRKRTYRILYGEEAQEGEFPSVVWLTVTFANIYLNETRTGKCSGNALSQRWILTAAHAVSPFNGMYPISAEVYAGSVQRGEGHMVPAHIFIPHPGFRRSDQWYEADIGLIRLDYSLPFAVPRQGVPALPVRAARLPVQGQLFPTESAVTVVGWGDTETGQLPDVLQKQTFYGFHYLADQLVLRGDNGGPCFGDSGGPLYVSDPSTGAQITAGVFSRGLVGMGIRNCSLPRPIFYVNIAEHRHWIRYHTGV